MYKPGYESHGNNKFLDNVEVNACAWVYACIYMLIEWKHRNMWQYLLSFFFMCLYVYNAYIYINIYTVFRGISINADVCYNT